MESYMSAIRALLVMDRKDEALEWYCAILKHRQITGW